MSENENNEIDFKLKENQERFFCSKSKHIENFRASGDVESLAKTATFLLNQLEDSLKANESIKEKARLTNENCQKQLEEMTKEMANYKHRSYHFFGALQSIYRMVDRHAGDEIRASLEKNDRTQKQGQLRKLMEEMKKLSA